MGILSWVLLGLVAGVLAKWLMPGKDPGGLIVTILIGIAGAFIGGYIATHLGFGAVDKFDVRGVGVAVGGALLLLLGYRMIVKA